MKKSSLKKAKKKCPTLKIKEDEAKVVRMIFDMYVNEDMGRINICHRLDSLGIKAPKGKYWSPYSLKDMLENVHYIGKVKWNWRKIVTVVEDGEVKKTAPKSKDYLIYEGKHEAIISEELFNQAKDKQGRTHRAKPSTKIRNPLAGLLWCSCGRAMSLRTYKKDGKERSAPRLLCDNQAICKTSSCLYDEMIKKVMEALKVSIKDIEVKIKNNDSEIQKKQLNLIKQLEARKRELEKKEISQWEKYSEEGMPKEVFEKLNEKVLKEKKEVEHTIIQAKSSTPNIRYYEEKLYNLRTALETLSDDDASPALKNRLLKTCIERIDYSRDKAIRVTSDMAKDKKLTVGGHWTSPPIHIKIKLKV